MPPAAAAAAAAAAKSCALGPMPCCAAAAAAAAAAMCDMCDIIALLCAAAPGLRPMNGASGKFTLVRLLLTLPMLLLFPGEDWKVPLGAPAAAAAAAPAAAAAAAAWLIPPMPEVSGVLRGVMRGPGPRPKPCSPTCKSEGNRQKQQGCCSFSIPATLETAPSCTLLLLCTLCRCFTASTANVHRGCRCRQQTVLESLNPKLLVHCRVLTCPPSSMLPPPAAAAAAAAAAARPVALLNPTKPCRGV
jgi:hypothetical protein